MATGVRQPTYNCFKQAKAVSVQRVFMSIEIDGLHISIDGREIENIEDRLSLAINDGFENWNELEDWFSPLVEKEEGKEFSGRIIHWTEYRY